ncbi:MAG TPA: ATPase domain-containing protein [Longimicrobiaceae bacterium]|nr:ATPase domain-containing protein [Longimicrobiaceae bacterium]
MSPDVNPGATLEEEVPRVSTGNPQVDSILGGGFPANSINLVMGQPGTGKTIFAEELIFHSAGDERPILYLTTLSEPLTKVVHYLQGFRFFDETKFGTSVIYDDVGAELVDEGIGAFVPRLKDAIKTMSPRVIVIDSFKAIHDLAPSVPEMRRLVYEIAGLLTAYGATTFLLGEYSEADIPRYPEFAVADGIVELSRRRLGSRDERFFSVLKLRGSRYLEGAHAFRITDAGLDVYPRLVGPAVPEDYEPIVERVSTGVAGLDAMTGGGLWRGSTTLLAGPSGSGKTTLGLQFALDGARRGEPGLYINFQENPTQLARSVRGLGVDLDEARAGGLELMYASPVELQIDSIIEEIFGRIRDNGIQRLVLDAVGDLASSATDPQRLHDYLYALVQHFTVNRVTSVLAFETLGPTNSGHTMAIGPISYMADNVILLEMGGEERTRRTVRVMKTRGSAHDPQVRELEIGADGVLLA